MTMTQAKADPEGAVRQYLLYLEDPSQLRDETEIQRVTQAVLEARDPIEKLKAVNDLEQVAKIDEGPLRAGFVEHAKAWAEEHGIAASAFRELRVPDDVLREAGFEVPSGGGRRRRGRTVADGTPRQRAKAVPVDQIKSHVLGRRGTFTLADVQNAVGGSPATVRKAVDELVESGQVEKLGPSPDYRGRGRAPIQYSRS
ncbi:MAG TPA: hypothetical protein VFW63_10920 [Acidimicrobiales bacterium]|nr:hypothetical protein [Acidimicrobiales bacterium]